VDGCGLADVFRGYCKSFLVLRGREIPVRSRADRYVAWRMYAKGARTHDDHDEYKEEINRNVEAMWVDKLTVIALTDKKERTRKRSWRVLIGTKVD
jgi:hypothetical protein